MLLADSHVIPDSIRASQYTEKSHWDVSTYGTVYTSLPNNGEI